MPLSEGVTGLLPWKQQHLKLLSGNFRGASLRSTGRTRSHPAPRPPCLSPTLCLQRVPSPGSRPRVRLWGRGQTDHPTWTWGIWAAKETKLHIFFPKKTPQRDPSYCFEFVHDSGSFL